MAALVKNIPLVGMVAVLGVCGGLWGGTEWTPVFQSAVVAAGIAGVLQAAADLLQSFVDRYSRQINLPASPDNPDQSGRYRLFAWVGFRALFVVASAWLAMGGVRVVPLVAHWLHIPVWALLVGVFAVLMIAPLRYKWIKNTYVISSVDEPVPPRATPSEAASSVSWMSSIFSRCVPRWGSEEPGSDTSLSTIPSQNSDPRNPPWLTSAQLKARKKKAKEDEKSVSSRSTSRSRISRRSDRSSVRALPRPRSLTDIPQVEADTPARRSHALYSHSASPIRSPGSADAIPRSESPAPR